MEVEKWNAENDTLEVIESVYVDNVRIRFIRAPGLDSRYFSHRNAVLTLLCGAVLVAEQVASWVSPSSLDSKESRLSITAQRNSIL